MKLLIAAALSHRPKLLILDEATSGLDPVMRDEMLEVFWDFVQDEEHSILMSSHITTDLERIADRITFLHRGKLLFCKPKDELLDRYGILRCGAADFAKIDKADILACRARGLPVERAGRGQGGGAAEIPAAGAGRRHDRRHPPVGCERGAKSMKSLVLKDLFNIAHNAKSMAIILLLFAAIFIPTSGAEGYLFISAILCSMMIVTTFAFDDACKWPRYALTMPLSKRDLVRGKFAVLAIFCTVGTVLGLLLGAVGGLLARKVSLATLPSLCFLALPAWGFAMLLGSLSIPLVFRFGSERGRILLILSFLVPAGLFLGAHRLLLLLGIELTGQIVLALLGVLPLFALLFGLLMEQVSVRVFSRQEV